MKTTLPILFQRRHILPDGRLPLRIAPGVQMETIKIALENDGYLGICMFDSDSEQEFFEIGTRVRIVDFDTDLVDGLMQIIVQGVDTYEVQYFGQNETGVCFGDCKVMSRWPDTKPGINQKLLVERLHIMYDKYPELDELHEIKQFNNLSWLCQRWLEILPVPIKEKQWLINKPNCMDTCDYLMSLMQDPH